VPSPALSSLIPLSLLEAIRNLDTPLEDGLDELAAEAVAKRFGLSLTVAAQIERYREDAEKGGTVPRDEVVGVFRLVGRRPDASLCFADAGRRSARLAIKLAGGSGRLLAKMPGGMGLSIGGRAATRLAREIFDADLVPDKRGPTARVAGPLTVEAIGDSSGCVFYGAVFAELLRGLVEFEGAMFHEQCCANGASACEWRGTAAEVYD
jgi:hypothetical protein